MSYDYNVLIIDPMTQRTIGSCDHQQSFERYVVDFNDFRTLHYAGDTTLNIRAPINGADLIRMWIHNEEVQSNDPTYGWSLIRDNSRSMDADATGDIFYKILFNKPVRITTPLIEISYITRQDYCLKCSALGVLNDLKPTTSGAWLRVYRQPKLAQKSLKWILSSRCAFYPTFVCPLKSYVGRKLGINLTDADIQTSVTKALSTMQQVQQAQQTIQSLDPLEMIKDIQFVTANVATDDPTTIKVSAAVTTFNNTTVPLAFQMQVNS